MLVSVIIPVHDTVDTLPDTLASLIAQRHALWEAIVVDDGSTRDVAAAVARAAPGPGDARIRVVRQERAGVSAARNRGIADARGEWLLFLDADDWIAPDALAHLVAAVEGDPSLDAVHAGWARVLPDGTHTGVRHAALEGDLFPELARYCVFVIHACLVRRAVVQRVGGFDPALRTNEDWDLWQRIARTGARFGAVPEVLALYRTRAGSASADRARLLADALTVIARGHAPDPRVAEPAPAHRAGAPRGECSDAQLTYACWPLALAIGSGADVAPLLALLRDVGATPGIDPDPMVRVFVEAVPLARGAPPSAWPDIWTDVESALGTCLDALEERTGAPELARRLHRGIETAVLDDRLCAVERVQAPDDAGKQRAPASAHDGERPDATARGAASLAAWTAVGRSAGGVLQLEHGVPDVVAPPRVEHLRVHARLGADAVGTISLPVCDGVVPARVLGDAVAAAHAWELLRLLRSRWRGEPIAAADHDTEGWGELLRDIWGLPALAMDAFYDASAAVDADTTAPECPAPDGIATVEVSEPVPAVVTDRDMLVVRVTVGGVSTGMVAVQPADGRIAPHALRVAITMAMGYELCIAAVREVLLAMGTAGDDTAGSETAHTLRGALSRSAARCEGSGMRAGQSATVPGLSGEPDARGLVQPHARGLLLERRDAMVFGTSASRWAALPARSADALRESARAAGERVAAVDAEGQTGDAPTAPAWAVYRPDVLPDAPSITTAQSAAADAAAGVLSPASAAGARSSDIAPREHAAQEAARAPWGRAYFERLFATSEDPWSYISPYEQRKYEQTLSLLPRGRIARALELACAEGHFTVQLAPRVAQLVAADISSVALERAKLASERAGLDNVRFERLDFMRDPIPGQWDLIICSEVLYFADDPAQLQRVADALARALAPGGVLLAAHANLRVDQPTDTGFDWSLPCGGETIARTLASTPGLVLERVVRTDLYRVLRLRRVPSAFTSLGRSLVRLAPGRIVQADVAMPEPHVARHIIYATRQDGHAAAGEAAPDATHTETAAVARVAPDASPQPPVLTHALPILLYHRVADDGAPATAGWRITPAAFEEQLAYLRDSGYQSATIEEWHEAVRTRRALPGRRVLITFDDGPRDFLTHAWPLLRRYGFGATLFLVTDLVGGWNEWDARYGERVPLLSWDEVRQLADDGVALGSHSARHRALAALEPHEVVTEAARSRAAIARHTSGGAPPRAFAFPYGVEDAPARHLVGAAGYAYAFTVRMRRARLTDPLLALPRILIAGADDLGRFVTKVESPA
ncbi:MAG TPA: glycosyltransferase [Gemmatimonadaceae bacterium]|nr:glycosyltransferase [Gemmatimonadaceae bacterium]